MRCVRLSVPPAGFGGDGAEDGLEDLVRARSHLVVIERLDGVTCENRARLEPVQALPGRYRGAKLLGEYSDPR